MGIKIVVQRGIVMAWVAKNKDGSETIYEVKPYKYNDEWISRKDGWERPINTLIFHKVA